MSQVSYIPIRLNDIVSIVTEENRKKKLIEILTTLFDTHIQKIEMERTSEGTDVVLTMDCQRIKDFSSRLRLHLPSNIRFTVYANGSLLFKEAFAPHGSHGPLSTYLYWWKFNPSSNDSYTLSIYSEGEPWIQFQVDSNDLFTETFEML